MSLKNTLMLGLLGVMVCVPAVADAQLGGASSAAVTFNASGPAGLKIEGKGSELLVKDDSKDVLVTVPLANMKTGIDLRDKHMREKYLEVGKYPNAELKVSRASLKFPAGGPSSGSAQGTLSIHGKSKSVPFSYSAKSVGGSKYEVTGDVKININDFGIEIPNYLGVTVKPDVDISVRFVTSDS